MVPKGHAYKDEEAWGAVAAAYLGVAQEEELLGAEVQVGQRGLPTAP